MAQSKVIALAIGTVAGVMAAGGTWFVLPPKVETVTVTEQVTRTPAICHEFISISEQVIAASSDAVRAIGESLRAQSEGDIASSDEHLTRADLQTRRVESYVEDFQRARDECQQQ